MHKSLVEKIQSADRCRKYKPSIIMKKVLVYSIVMMLIAHIGNAVARSKNSKMPDQPIKLYYLPPSPPCRAVMMTAKVLGLELDLVLTNLMEGAHMTPEFLKMNPQHTIPTMDDSGFILWESRAIMCYLVNAYGRDDTLYPKNPRQRALVDQRLNFDLGTLYMRYISLYGPMIFKGDPMDDEKAAKLNEAIGWFNTVLEGRTFVAGDNLTIADISLIVTFTCLDAFEYSFSEYENVQNWFERTKKALEPYGYDDIDVAGAQMLNSFMKNH
uniref:Glutathione S-transferase delta 1 n=1 Tax=Heortia vitessoides TaxID=1557813 RepID=A0A3G1RJ75_9NEOP|nr:glutathione S-transferase delta 1 [Heortia vitessoides]